MKLMYYEVFASAYAAVGWFTDLAFVNSSWTQGHINDIWDIPRRTHRLYPPCDTRSLTDLPLEPRDRVILSVGQFRPEKRHAMQLQAFRMYLDTASNQDVVQSTKLVLVGGCRDGADIQRVEELKGLCSKLKLMDHVEFKLNISYADLKKELGRARIGVHTMWNEHFGIGVVEYMASGAIAVAHKSGGPLMDIVTPYQNEPTGFLAETVEEYADIFAACLDRMSADEMRSIQQNARRSCLRFSENAFETRLLELIGPVLRKE
jgi:alpha-1,2-mannosyltransferase